MTCSAHDTIDLRMKHQEDLVQQMAEHVGNMRADVAALKEIAVIIKEASIVERLSALEAMKKPIVLAISAIGAILSAIIIWVKGV